MLKRLCDGGAHLHFHVEQGVVKVALPNGMFQYFSLKTVTCRHMYMVVVTSIQANTKYHANKRNKRPVELDRIKKMPQR